MGKRLLALAAALVMTAGISANAALLTDANSVTAVQTGDEVSITAKAGMDGMAVAAFYDKDGRLVYANGVKPVDGEYKLTVKADYKKARLYYGEAVYNVVSALEIAPIRTRKPDAEIPPQPTQKVEIMGVTTPTPVTDATAAPTTTKKPLASVYEKEADAIRAYYVVDEVASYMKDNADAYLITAYRQGEKVEVSVDADKLISAAPELYSGLTGLNAGALEKGDVVVFGTNLSRTEVRDIKLIYRITDIFGGEEYGADFERLLANDGKVGGESAWTVMPFGKRSNAKYQYAFGIITAKHGSSFTLYPLSGEGDKQTEIDFAKDTYVYTCDMDSKRREPVIGIGGVMDIAKSGIPSSAFDDAENVTFTGDYRYNLALIRLVNGTAAEVVVYQNVEF